MKYPCLKLLDPVGPKQYYELDEGPVVIGRSSEADISLVDPYLSRQHARLQRQENQYTVVDMESTQGTFVNDRQVPQQTLQHGDLIRVGRTELLFLTGAAEEKKAGAADHTTEFELKQSLTQLGSVLASPEYAHYSELEKMSYILDFQYQWGQSFSYEQTFQQLLDSALRISGAQRGFVLAKEEQGFQFKVGRIADKPALSQHDFRMSQTIVDRVVKGGEPVFLTAGIEGDLAKQESIVAMHLRAVACLPLKGISSSSSPELLGILYMDSREPMHTLSGLDEKILRRLAVEAGNLLEKVELVKSVEERRKYEQEMGLAYETQRSLLPRELPRFAGFDIGAFSAPTRHVGGDFYDFLETGPDRLVGVLADVSGKGVPAALLSSLVQGALDIEYRSRDSMGEVLSQVNQLLCRRSRSDSFVTLFCFALDREGEGLYCSAGHNPAYLYRSSSGEIEQLESQAMVLGAFEFATYEPLPLRLDPGDVLLVYSDGVTEASNPTGEMFEEWRLRRIIQSEAGAGVKILQQKVLDGLDEFTEGMPQTDDVTLVLVQR